MRAFSWESPSLVPQERQNFHSDDTGASHAQHVAMTGTGGRGGEAGSLTTCRATLSREQTVVLSVIRPVDRRSGRRGGWWSSPPPGSRRSCGTFHHNGPRDFYAS